ncbi:hypothetical protein ACA910_014132 [Epithemia clementina (nom. ined.)]
MASLSSPGLSKKEEGNGGKNFPKPLASKTEVANPFDVLLGRGKGFYERRGNKAYMDIIFSYLPSYKAATGNKDKIRITEDIVALVKKGGGRFVAVDDVTLELFQVSDAEARIKVSQALRHQRLVIERRKIRKMLSAAPASHTLPPIHAVAAQNDQHDMKEIASESLTECSHKEINRTANESVAECSSKLMKGEAGPSLLKCSCKAGLVMNDVDAKNSAKSSSNCDVLPTSSSSTRMAKDGVVELVGDVGSDVYSGIDLDDIRSFDTLMDDVDFSVLLSMTSEDLEQCIQYS